MGVVSVEKAKSGRSRCKSCQEPLAQGDTRAGVEAFVSGRVVMTWQHPRCCCEDLEAAKGNGGSCKATKEKIEKGSVRVCVRSGGSKFYLSLGAAPGELREALQEAGVDASDLPGVAALPEEKRSELLESFGAAGGEGAESDEEKPPAKRHKKEEEEA